MLLSSLGGDNSFRYGAWLSRWLTVVTNLSEWKWFRSRHLNVKYGSKACGFSWRIYILMMNFYSNCREFYSVLHATSTQSQCACNECAKQTTNWIFLPVIWLLRSSLSDYLFLSVVGPWVCPPYSSQGLLKFYCQPGCPNTGRKTKSSFLYQWEWPGELLPQLLLSDSKCLNSISLPVDMLEPGVLPGIGLF